MYAFWYKMQKLEQGITLKKIIQFFSQVNLVIYLLPPLYSTCFKDLGQWVFVKSCLKDFNIHFYKEKLFWNMFLIFFPKLIIIPNMLIMFQGPSSNSFWNILLTRFQYSFL